MFRSSGMRKHGRLTHPQSGCRYQLFAVALTVLLLGTAPVGATTLDFSTDDGGTPLVNGQSITTPPFFGNLVNLSFSFPGSPGAPGLAIFDSTPGVNSEDQDLQVKLGNILVLQDPDFPDKTVGVFDTPGDTDTLDFSNNPATIIFDFLSPSRLLSIDLVDADSPNLTTVKMTDTFGRMRTYTVGDNFSFDINKIAPGTGNGYQTLDLTTLAVQVGEGGGMASAAEDVGFNPLSVLRLEVAIIGSVGIDNLSFVPEPSAGGMLGLGLLGLLPLGWRRWRRGR